MTSDQIILLLSLASLGLVVLVVLLVWLLVRTRRQADQAGQRRVATSRAVLMGQVTEHFAPLLPGFGFHPKDARFVGQPVDYLIYDGLTEADRPLSIVFCEIKSGQAGLSPTEKAIRQAVEAGRVRFEVRRLQADGTMRAEPPR